MVYDDLNKYEWLLWMTLFVKVIKAITKQTLELSLKKKFL